MCLLNSYWALLRAYTAVLGADRALSRSYSALLRAYKTVLGAHIHAS